MEPKINFASIVVPNITYEGKFHDRNVMRFGSDYVFMTVRKAVKNPSKLLENN